MKIIKIRADFSFLLLQIQVLLPEVTDYSCLYMEEKKFANSYQAPKKPHMVPTQKPKPQIYIYKPSKAGIHGLKALTLSVTRN